MKKKNELKRINDEMIKNIKGKYKQMDTEDQNMILSR